jgi:hypothetical protein
MVRSGMLKTWRAVMAMRGRHRRLAVSGAVLVLLAACSGYLLPATSVGTTTATLLASTTCSGTSTSNPCTGWFQYWAQGAGTTVSTTPTTNNTAQTTTLPANITGLTPNTVYHDILCGYGDTNIPAGTPACTGPLSAGATYFAYTSTCTTLPCATPSTGGDFSDTGNFRTGATGLTGTVDLGRVLSAADTPTLPISRDGGISVSYQAGQALWLFGDTSQSVGGSNQFLGGTTAAIGPYTAGQAPQALNEVPTPPASPATGLTRAVPFLPPPTGLPSTCDSSRAWTMGAAQEPGSSKVLIVYGEMCTIGPAFTEQGLALIEYNPLTNQFVTGSTPEVPFFTTAAAGLPALEALGHPVFGGDGYLYLFTTTNTFAGTGPNAVYVARVLASAAFWGNAANYGWYNGTTTWPSSPSSAIPIYNFGSGTVVESVSVGNYSATTTHKYVALVQTWPFGSGQFTVLSAPAPTGPWSPGPTVIVPDPCPVLPGEYGCYAIEGHPELSASGNLVYSWYSIDDQFSQATAGSPSSGHIRLGNIAW